MCYTYECPTTLCVNIKHTRLLLLNSQHTGSTVALSHNRPLGGSVIDTTTIDTHGTFTQTHSILSHTYLNAAEVGSRSASLQSIPSLNAQHCPLCSLSQDMNNVHHCCRSTGTSFFFFKFPHADQSSPQALISKQQAVPALCTHMTQTCLSTQ